MNLDTLVESQRLVLIDAMSSLAPNAEWNPTSGLKSLYNQIRSTLQSQVGDGRKRLVILDDLAACEWMGISSQEIVRFSRALCALCRHVSAWPRLSIVYNTEDR